MFTRKSALKLLANEKAAILVADFDGLAAIEPDKAKLVHDIAALTRADLKVIAQRLEENQALLEQAQAGISAAQDRVAALQKATNELTIYAADGSFNVVNSAASTTSRKA